MGVRALWKSFTGEGLVCRRGERWVFKGVAFMLTPGGALLLAGPNGSGKTSLLRLMAGLAQPEHGRLAWDGTPIDDDLAAHRGRLHFIGHQDAIKLALSAEENLTFWARMHGSANHAEAALDRFRLKRRASWPARYLSAGERKRLALARILASPATLWLLDEPTTGLDAASQEVLLTTIDEHRHTGGCVAIATHAAMALPGAQTVSLAQHVTARDA